MRINEDGHLLLSPEETEELRELLLHAAMYAHDARRSTLLQITPSTPAHYVKAAEYFVKKDQERAARYQAIRASISYAQHMHDSPPPPEKELPA